MKKLLEFFARRPVLGNIIIVMILLLGLNMALTINKDLFPKIKFNQVMVTTQYPGASPEDVELNVTRKIEKHIKGIDGVKNTSSLSLEGMSVITVNLDENLKQKKIESVTNIIWEAAVVRVKDLPAGVEGKPMAYRVSMDFIPILGIGIAGGGMSYGELREYGKSLEKKLLDLPGVASVEAAGFMDKEVSIEVKPEKLAYYRIPVTEVVDGITKKNIRSTAGILESYSGEKSVVTISEFKNPAEVGQVFIRKEFDGRSVKVEDLALIKEGYEKKSVTARLNGENVIFFNIRKKAKADIISTVDEIKELIKDEEKYHKGKISVLYSQDLSRYVKSSFDVLVKNGITGILLVILVLTFFLNSRVSFWVALGIPVSLFATIILLPRFNVTLDLLTLSAMILVLGIIVDDAIVVSERIYARWEKGEEPFEAAVNGINDVFWPVVTSVLTTLLAFLPMFLIPGDIGKFIKVIPTVVTIALLISIVECSITLPAHIAHSLQGRKRGKGGKKKKGLFAFNPGKILFSLLQRWFTRVLARLLPWRYLIILFFTISFGFTVYLGYTRLQIVLFPVKGAEEFDIYLEAPIGTSLNKTEEMTKEVEQIVATLPGSELLSITSLIGSQNDETSRPHIAMVHVDLTPFAGRKRTAPMIIEELRQQTGILPGFETIRYDVSDAGPNPEKPVNLKIAGENTEVRNKLAGDIVAFLQTVQGVTDIDRDDKRGKEQINVKLDPAKTALYGLNNYEVARALRILYKGEHVTQAQFGDDIVKFRISYPKNVRDNPRDLLSLTIPNNRGQHIPLSRIGSLETIPGLATYRHYNGERVITVQANVNNKKILPEEVTALVLQQFDLVEDYPGIRIIVEGESKKKKEAYKKLGKVFIFALIGIYFLLVLLFNSSTQPLLVLSAIPFGIMGVILVFVLHNESLSFMGMLGVIGLIGVVVNDSLLMIDHLNKMVKAHPQRKRLHLISSAASDRLRAIIMTSITTVAGLLPLAYGIGGSNPLLVHMALALGWGLVFATPLTLIMVPCLYTVSLDLRVLKEKMLKPRDLNKTAGAVILQKSQEAGD